MPALNSEMIDAAGGDPTARRAIPPLYWGQAANRCFMPRNIIAGANTWAKTEDVVFTTQAGAPRVGWARWRVSNALESYPVGDGTLLVRMEYPAGVFTYARENIAAGAPGSPAPVPHLTNTTLFLNFDTFVPAWAAPRFRVIQVGDGVVFRQGQIADQAPPGCYLNNGTGTPPTMEAAFAGQAGEYSYPPVAYLVQHRAPSVLSFADSRNEAGQEGGRAPYYNNGLTLPALHGAGIGYTSLAESGTGLNQMLAGTAAQRARRIELAQYFSHVECAWGYNDLNAYNRTVAQLLADYSTFAALFPNNIVYQTTMMGSTATTDANNTLANQTISANGLKTLQANFAIRNGIAGMRFFLDVADAANPSRDGKFPVGRDQFAAARTAPVGAFTASTSTATIAGTAPGTGTLTVTVAPASGSIYVGMPLTDSLNGNIAAALSGATIEPGGTGTGGTGTYAISRPSALSSRSMYEGGFATGDSIHPTAPFSQIVEKVLTPVVRTKVTR